MEKPVFLMIEATPNPKQKQALQSYLSHAPMIIKAHGGIAVATYNIETSLDKGEVPAIFAVISFPSRDAIEALLSDPAYKALIPERDRSFTHLRYYIAHESMQ